MKEMFRKRYATIHGTSYSSDRENYPCKKKKNRKHKQKKRGALKRYIYGGSDDRECVSIDRLMTYEDGLSGR